MAWHSIREPPAPLHVTYGGTYSNKIQAYDSRVRVGRPYELSLDLRPNTRDDAAPKPHHDTRDLELHWRGLALLLLTEDETVLERIGALSAPAPLPWRLTLIFPGGPRSYAAMPMFRVDVLELAIDAAIEPAR